MIYNMLELIKKIAVISSTNAKIDVLNHYHYDELVKRVFITTYNPFIKFWIRKIPDYVPTENPEDVAYNLTMALDKLLPIQNREITGNAAIEHLKNVLESVSSSDAKVLEMIIAGDLRCGVSRGLIDKVWPLEIPDFPYMRCSLPAGVNIVSWFENNGFALSQEKADGSFVFANIDYDGEVSFITRAGNPYPVEKFYDCAEAIIKSGARNKQFHGEFVVFDKNGILQERQIGNGILNSIAKGGDWEDFYPGIRVWDVIPLDEAIPKNKYEIPYYNRYNEVVEFFEVKHSNPYVKVIETQIVKSLEEAYEHYFLKLDEGKEGTVLKHPEGIWEDTTSKNSVKMKLEVDVDLEILGFNPGRGKNEHLFGSIACATSDRKLLVNVSGFKEKPTKGYLTREEIFAIKDTLIGTVMTVRINGITKSRGRDTYSSFLPRAIEFRNDKMVADTLEQVQEQIASVIKRAKDGK